MNEEDILRSELRWGAIALGVMVIILAIIVFTTIAFGVHPPSNIETIDPATLHIRGEFVDRNLGTTIGEDGRVIVRIVATQFAFVPSCVPVPANKPVEIRLATPDVIHGILVTGTNVNTMVVPGYVSDLHAVFKDPGDLLMPCHEYCGIGHSEMWATVRVLPESQWPHRPGKVSCAAR